VPGAAGDLGGGHPGVEPQRHRRVPQVVGAPGELDRDGSPLVDAACPLSSGPVIRFNSLSTHSMVKGLFSTFRNLAAHAPKAAWATSRSDALDMLTLASMLHRLCCAKTLRVA